MRIGDNGDLVTPLDRIRCLSIIAHIDHGKSTLADRLLEMTGAVDPRDMRAQSLDTMDLERERGITIKTQNVRLEWHGYIVNLIDTPGHVDFGYEVSRSLAACEGVILIVDASQGIEAQTLANCYLAVEHDLTIVAALNKIDLPAAEPDRVAAEIEHVLGIPADEILKISAKTGEGVPELLDAVVERVPPPKGDPDAPLQALIFDSYYDPYRGVVSAVRVMNGTLTTGSRLRFIQVAATHDAEEIGVRLPEPTPVAGLGPGEVGYLIAGIKDVGQARVGETVTLASRPAEPLVGYRDPKPMVFCGLYPVEGDDFADLREALEKLRLNDSSFTYAPETSGALGFGFRCGFLGLLHMEIIRERLEREYDLSLVATAPNVEYLAHTTDGKVELVDNVPVDAFSTVVHKDRAEDYGRKMATKLRSLIPRQLFDVPIQAAIGSRVIARETVKAKRKDVLAKCYGGDITRKRKLLEKQKEGKKRMKMVGSVEIPQEAFLAVLRIGDET